MGTGFPELLTINLETDQVIILHVLTNMTQANMAIYIENYFLSYLYNVHQAFMNFHIAAE